MKILLFHNNVKLFDIEINAMFGYNIFNTMKKNALVPRIKLELHQGNNILEIYES